MSVKIRYPNITGGSEREQLAQIKSFLYQLVDQLNYALSTLDTDTATAQTGSTSDHDYEELRALIMRYLNKDDS